MLPSRWIFMLMPLSLALAPATSVSEAGSSPDAAGDVVVALDPTAPVGIGDLTVTVTGTCDSGSGTAGVLISQSASETDVIMYEEVAVVEAPVDDVEGTFEAVIDLPQAFPNIYGIETACAGTPLVSPLPSMTFTIANDPDLSMTLEPVTGHLGEPLEVTASGNLCPGEEIRIAVVDTEVGLFGPPTQATVSPDEAGNWTATFTVDSNEDDSGTYGVYARCHKLASSEAYFAYGSAEFSVTAVVLPPAPPQAAPPDFTG
jgi:hypothetical protein